MTLRTDQTASTPTFPDHARDHRDTNAQVNQNTSDIAGKVSKAGDTMTGPLILSGAPTTDLQAATKLYVDENGGGGGGSSTWGGITGTLSNQTDMQAALDAKLAKTSNLSDVSSVSSARSNLGLGTIATQAASAVAITGGTVAGITDVTVADGGTGSSTAAGARTNLGVAIGTDVEAAVVAGTAAQYYRGDKSFQDLNTAVRTNRLDQMAAPTASVSLNSEKITNLLDPTSAQDAASKSYVDGVAQGLTIKTLVKLGTATALASNSYSGGVLTASGNGALSVDGVAVTVADRILVKNETTQANNGIYDVTATGDGSHPYVLTRSSDMDAGAEVPHAYTFVSSGTVNAGSGWAVQGAGPFTLGTTAIVWTEFSNAGAIVGGAGLVKTGSTLDVVAASGITVNPDSVGVDYSAVQAKNTALDGLSALGTPGLVTDDGAGGINARTITAASSKVAVTNGSGVSGNPTIDVNEVNLTLSNQSGTLGVAHGGTGQTTAVAAFDALSPTTSLGDLIYRTGSTNARLAGNVTAAKLVLTQIGTGTISAAPAWGSLLSTDLGDAADLVHLDGIETITGAKTIQSTLTIDNADIDLVSGTLTGTGGSSIALDGSIAVTNDNITITNGNLNVHNGNVSLDATSGISAAPGAVFDFGANVITGIANGSSATDVAAFGQIPGKVAIVVGPTGDSGYITDGTADDVQINAAIVAVTTAGGGTVWLQPGTFNIASAIAPFDLVHLRGAGMFGTKLAATSGLTTGVIDDKSYRDSSGVPLIGFILSDLEIDGTNFTRPSGRKGINSSGWQNCYVYQVYCHDCTATGLGMDDLYQCVIDNCLVVNNGTPGVVATITLTSDNTNVSAGDTVVVANAQAGVTLTSTGTNPSDGDTLTLGSITYTFKGTLSTANDVFIGSTAAITLANLQAAINASSGSGTKYGTGTTANTQVGTGKLTNTTLRIVADLYGGAGNSIASTETSSQLSFGSTTLSGGTDTTYTFVSSLAVAYDVLIGATADNSLTNLASAINASSGAGTTYGTGTIANPRCSAGTVTAHAVVLSAVTDGAGTSSIAFSETSAHLSFSAATFTGGSSVAIGNNGIGIATGGKPSESFVVSNCVAMGNANNDYLIEEDNHFEGAVTQFIFSNNTSINAGHDAFHNSGTPDVQFIGNAVYAPAVMGISIKDATGAHTSYNNIIKGNRIKGAGKYGIYIPTNQNQQLIEGNNISDSSSHGIICGASAVSIIGNDVHNNGGAGISVGGFSGSTSDLADILVANNRVYDNSQTSANNDGITLSVSAVNLSNVTVVGNRCFDDQPTQTQRYGISLGASNGTSTMSGILVAHNNVAGNLNSAGLLKNNSFAGVSIKNNPGFNPDNSYSLGSVSGAVTFARINGSLQQATLTGNITVTIASGSIIGETMTLELVQDSTGGWTVTWPSNVKPAQGGLTLSTAANAIDVVTYFWDGTNWRESSRALNTVSLGTLAHLTITDPSGGNAVALAVTQSDTTNNPDAADFTNSGTANGVKISQNGVLAANKYGLFVDSSADQVNAPLVRMRESSASSTTATLQLDNAGSGAALAIATGGAQINAGNVTLLSGVNIATATVTGTKIGTATNQKLAFYNSTPIVQPTGNALTALTNLGLVGSPTLAESDVTSLVSDLALKAPLASPALTGSPTAPTQSANDNSTKLATTAYVDGAISGLDAKDPVAYASTSALPANTYANGSSGVGATLTGTSNGFLIIDGVTLAITANGLRVLVAGEAAPANNGWYTITDVGSVITKYVLTRDAASDQAAEIESGYITAVSAPSGLTGGANNGKAFISAAPSPFTVGTSSLTFSSMGSAYTASTGLTLTGAAFSIDTSVTVDKTTAQTLTGKRVSDRITALSANSATPTINTDNCDVVHITSQTAAITSFTTNLSGTPVDGDTLRISITGTASVAITWGASFEASTVALPTTTSSTTRLDVGFIWNTETSKWRCMAVA